MAITLFLLALCLPALAVVVGVALLAIGRGAKVVPVDKTAHATR